MATTKRRIGLLLFLICAAVAPINSGRAQEDEPKKTMPPWMQRWSRVNERNSKKVKAAFREVVQTAAQSTVRIYCDKKETSLGAIVDADGYVLTKASEIITRGGELKGIIACTLNDGRQYNAELVGVERKHDLAMLKIDEADLPALHWTSSPAPAPGSWLATPGPEADPIAIGVLAAAPRKIEPARGVLGVILRQTSGGPVIEKILKGGSADKAGLKVGDLVIKVDRHLVDTVSEAVSRVQTFRPGDKVVFDLMRGEKELTLEITLGDISVTPHGKRAEFQRALGRELSDRKDGFPLALQHDTILDPVDCGGPLVDLDGLAIGINIASADRVSSYALPAATVLPLLDDLKSGKLSPQPAEPSAEEFARRIEQLQGVVERWKNDLAKLQRTFDAASKSHENLAKADDADEDAIKKAARYKAAAEKAVGLAKVSLERAISELEKAEAQKVSLDKK